LNIETLVLVLVETCILLAIYTYLAYKFLNVKQLMTHYKRAYSIMGERSGDSKRTKVLENALVTGVLKDENPILAAAIEYGTEILENEGVEVDSHDLMLLLNSDQARDLFGPMMERLKERVQGQVDGVAKPAGGESKYELKHTR